MGEAILSWDEASATSVRDRQAHSGSVPSLGGTITPLKLLTDWHARTDAARALNSRLGTGRPAQLGAVSLGPWPGRVMVLVKGNEVRTANRSQRPTMLVWVVKVRGETSTGNYFCPISGLALAHFCRSVSRAGFRASSG